MRGLCTTARVQPGLDLMGEKWRTLSFGTREAELGKVAASRRDGIPGLRRSGFGTLRATGRPHGRSWSWGRAGEGDGAALCTSRRAVWPTESRSSPSIVADESRESPPCVSAAGTFAEALGNFRCGLSLVFSSRRAVSND